ncbi:MAG: hypothetical protein ACRDNZ_20520 [Streptosporangiaceae bacterium]
MTTSEAEYARKHPRRGVVPIEELARRKGVRPVESIEDMAQDGAFESAAN